MDGDLFCWGSNDHYQLGIGTMVQSPGIDRGQTMSILVPSVNPKVRNVVVVACGWQHTIAIADPINLTDNLTTHHESKAFCWGDNKFGQLGILSDSAIVHCPTQINLSSLTQPYRVRSVSCGWKHSLLATATGEVWNTVVIGNGDVEEVSLCRLSLGEVADMGSWVSVYQLWMCSIPHKLGQNTSTDKFIVAGSILCLFQSMEKLWVLLR